MLCSKFFSLFLSELQHTFARELKDTRAEEKGKVTLECETRRPAKRVTWLKGMVELKSSRKYVIRQKDVVLSLTITCLEKVDTDIYICDVGTMQSRAQLTVQGETTLTWYYITVVQGCLIDLLSGPCKRRSGISNGMTHWFNLKQIMIKWRTICTVADI